MRNPTDRLARWIIPVVASALAACAPLATHEMPPRIVAQLDAEGKDCARLLAAADAAIARAHVADAMTSHIRGFPYLRVNRFLASYRNEAMDQAGFADWSSHMTALAVDGYAVEAANLAPAARATIAGEAPLQEALVYCIAHLRETDLASSARQLALREVARVPDDYADWKRVVGLYYLTRIPFSAGVRRSQQHLQALFEQPLQFTSTRRIRYQPTAEKIDAGQVSTLIQRVRRGPLQIPDPQGEDLDALFATFAPRFEIDSLSNDDLIGAMTWFGSLPVVDTNRPVIYTQLSHARVRGKALLQLNYVAWFPARPKQSIFDPLGGHLDGLTWRVTLDENGVPLLFESMHNCGCYHEFVLTPRAQAVTAAVSWDDPVQIVQVLSNVSAGDVITLRVNAGSHYLYRVLLNDDSAAVVRDYVLQPYAQLRMLATQGGNARSIFDEKGLVRGSERLERYFFWPMGIAEPGAMRILGRHATAFVGRRHFDDSDLLEKNFIFARP